MKMSDRNKHLVSLQDELHIIIESKLKDFEDTNGIQFTSEEVLNALKAVTLVL